MSVSDINIMTTNSIQYLINNDKYTKNYSKWTKEDELHLAKLILLNYNFETIAKLLYRTEDAVKARFVKKMLIPKYNTTLLNNNIDLLCNTFSISKEDMIKYITYSIPSFKITPPKINKLNLI